MASCLCRSVIVNSAIATTFSPGSLEREHSGTAARESSPRAQPLYCVPSNLDVTVDYKTSHTLNTNQGRQTILLAGRLPFGWACKLMIKRDKLTLQISCLPRLAGKDFPARVTCTQRSKYRLTKAAARASILIGRLFIIINSGGTSQH